MRAILISLLPLLAILSPLPAQCCEWPPSGYILVDDMWLPSDVVYGDGVYTATPWPGGIVPFHFDGTVSPSQRSVFLKALAEIEAVCGVSFVPYTNQSNRIFIRENPVEANVSNSAIGMIGGQQIINVGSSHWNSKYIHVHETMHALGFLHEQSRPDRDTYVTINWANIEPGRENNFQLVNGAVHTGPYDFRSLMHYRQFSFSVNGLPTITCKPLFSQFQNQLGQLSYMTSLDANALALRYGQSTGPSVAGLVPSSAMTGGTGELWLAVLGSGFNEGASGPDGVQGSTVRFGLFNLETFYVDSNTLLARIPANLLQIPNPAIQVRVVNDALAGGTSSTFANFSLTAPPCTSQNDRIGYAVSGLGDVDGDGCDDFVVGAPGVNSAGRVWCFSGKSRAILWTATGSAGDELGFSLARIDDVTGDGIPDVLAGAPGFNNSVGRVRVLNGATGAIVRTLVGPTVGGQFGYSVSTAGDQNGDGVPDMIVGLPGYSTGGGARIYSGANGALIAAYAETLAGARFGHSVAGGLDVTGDGHPDFVVGAPMVNVLGAGTSAGQISIYNGATGTRTNRGGDGAYDYMGSSVAMIPALNGGAFANIVAGASENGTTGGSNAGPGYVRVFGSFSMFLPYPTLATYTGIQTWGSFGEAVADAGDIDQDGVTDILIGAPGAGGIGGPGPGYVQVRSGATGAVLWQRHGDNGGENFGWSVAGAGDLNGDGILDLVVGSPSGDVPCINAGGFHVFHPVFQPRLDKVMITEVNTENPASVEITNFGSSPANLTGFTIVWRGNQGLPNTVVGTLPSLTLQPGGIAVVKEPSGSLPEVPPGTPVIAALPSISYSTGPLAIGLRAPNGLVVDEFRSAGLNGSGPAQGAGGLFRGFARNFQPSGPFVAISVSHQRIWGLDTNGGEDWTSNAQRSMGLENANSGWIGYDPAPKQKVVINEVSHNPPYVELRRISSTLLPLANLDLEGWTLHASGLQGQAHTRLRLSAGSFPMPAGGYLVLGSGPAAPPEMPGSAVYVDLAAINGGLVLPLTTGEYSLALHDQYGRPVDVVRATGHDDTVAHNHPRSLARWTAFQGAAQREVAGTASIGRNATSTDTDTSSDWYRYDTRTMGTPNTAGAGLTAFPSGERGLDVRLNATGLGQGMTAILNAGMARAGYSWTLAFDVGHYEGQGPIFGLGPNAINNLILASTTPPFFGTLDNWGSARFDFPAGSVPTGIMIDTIFLLLNPQGILIHYTPILEYDS